jgi:hypothetical protein
LPERAVVGLDIGIALFLQSGQILTVYTNGTSFFVEAELQVTIPEALQSVVAVSFVE